MPNSGQLIFDFEKYYKIALKACCGPELRIFKVNDGNSSIAVIMFYLNAKYTFPNDINLFEHFVITTNQNQHIYEYRAHRFWLLFNFSLHNLCIFAVTP